MIKGTLPKGIEVSINGQQVLLDENVHFTVLATNNEQAASELFEIAGLHSVELTSVKPVKAKGPEAVEEVVVEEPTADEPVVEEVAEPFVEVVEETPTPTKTKKKK